MLYKLHLGITSAIAIIALLPSLVCAQEATSSPAVNLVPFPIPRDAEEIHKAVGDFQHAPYDKAGCSLLSLPFRYSANDSDRSKPVDRSEADAFAFLMSCDLDWIPGNYCSRHAYFVFERDPDVMKQLAAAYDSQLIGKSIVFWHDTSAVGGELHRTPTGIGGTLELYDQQGKRYFSKSFEPRDYTQLLADMDVEVMHQMGYDPPAALVQMLRQPRCEHAESISAAGKAAFLSREQMLPMFADLIAKDPKFAEVYAWWAQIYGWEVQHTHEAEQQFVLALRGRPTVMCLTNFFPDDSHSQDKQTFDLYRQAADRAAAIVGDDHPAVLAARLKLAKLDAQQDSGLFQRGLAAAAAYPNDGLLLVPLSEALIDAPNPQTKLGGAVAWVDEHSLYQPGIDSHSPEWDTLMRALLNMGRPELAVTAQLQYQETGNDYPAKLAYCLLESQRPRDVLDLFSSTKIAHDIYGTHLAEMAVAAAALLDDRETVKQINSQWSSDLASDHVEPILSEYLDAFAGKDFDLSLPKVFNQVHEWLPLRCDTVLAALADLHRHQTHAMKALFMQTSLQPQDPLSWALWDAYFRQSGVPDPRGFYDPLAWLFPDNPWVQQAVANYQASKAAPSTWNPEKVWDHQKQMLTQLETLRSSGQLKQSFLAANLIDNLHPYDMATTIHYLLQAHQFADAQELARRYHAVTVLRPASGLNAWSEMLLAKAADARQ